jgi:hypothetical protein
MYFAENFQKVWSSGSFTPTSRTVSEAGQDAFRQCSGHSHVSAASEDQHSHSFRNVYEQFSQSLHYIETDDDDEEQEDVMWDRSQADGHLSPTLKYQRMSASWRRSNNADR